MILSRSSGIVPWEDGRLRMFHWDEALKVGIVDAFIHQHGMHENDRRSGIARQRHFHFPSTALQTATTHDVGSRLRSHRRDVTCMESSKCGAEIMRRLCNHWKERRKA